MSEALNLEVGFRRPPSTTHQAGALTLLVLALLTLFGWWFTYQSPSQPVKLGEAQYSLGLSQFVGSAPANSNPASAAHTAQIEAEIAPKVDPFNTESSQVEIAPAEPTPPLPANPEQAPSQVTKPEVSKLASPTPAPKVENKAESAKSVKPEKLEKAEKRPDQRPHAQFKPQPTAAQSQARTRQPENAPTNDSATTTAQTNAEDSRTKVGASGTPAATASTQSRQGGNAPTLMVYGRDSHPVLAQIKAAIDRSLVYPRKSRMLREQGVAVVQFVYTPQGKLHRLSLLKSTGHKELDKAAMRAIKRASGHFPAVDRAYTLRLPIAFNLRG